MVQLRTEQRAGVFVETAEPKRSCSGPTASFGDNGLGEKHTRGDGRSCTTAGQGPARLQLDTRRGSSTLPPVRSLLSIAWRSLVFAGLAGCQIHAGPARDISGKDLYLRQCGRCHGPDGKGTGGENPVPDITPRLISMNDRELEHTITMGKPPRMPAFGEQFLEPSLRAVMAYARGLGKESPTTSKSLVAPSQDAESDTP